MNTTNQEITYHFKAFATTTDGYSRLAALVEAGKLSTDDIDITEADGVTKWKRKSVTVKAAVPVVAIEGYTPEMNDHVQYLIIKQLEAKNKENIDTVSGEWIEWDKVLQQPAVLRTAAVKVSAELVEGVVAALAEYMNEAGYPQPAVELIVEAGSKRFNANVCRGIKVDVLTKIDSIIKGWVEALDSESADTVKPVTDLWAVNIDKLVNPKTEVSADMFDL